MARDRLVRWVWLSVMVVGLVVACVGPSGYGAPTVVEFFRVVDSPIERGAKVALEWSVADAGTRAGVDSCALLRQVEGEGWGDPMGVPCVGTHSEVPPFQPSASSVSYRLRVARQPADALNPFVTRDVSVEFVVPSVVIVPVSASMGWGESLGFAASVSGAVDSSVTWSASGGLIDGSGSTVTYTSPMEVGSFTVTATSVADPSVSASASVVVVGEGAVVTVSIVPTYASLYAGETAMFSATVEGTSDATVAWSASCGQVDGTGSTATFEAPDDAGLCVVTATSMADPRRSAVATVEALGPRPAVLSVSILEGDLDLVVGAGPTQLTVEVVSRGGASETVVWSSSDSTVATVTTYGQVEAAGAGTATITARSAFDPSESDSVTVTATLTSGTVLWSDRFFAEQSWEEATSVAFDSLGRPAVAGSTAGGLGDLGNGYDGYVRVYDRGGGVVWTRRVGTIEHDTISGVTVDASNDIVVVGGTEGYLGDGTGTPDSRDAFVRKYGPGGQVLWTRQFGVMSGSFDEASAVAIDMDGSIVVGGWWRPYSDGTTPQPIGAWLAKFDVSGTPLWLVSFTFNDGTFANGVAIDSGGDIYVVGSFPFDGRAVGYVRKYASGGTLVWSREGPSDVHSVFTSVATDGSDNVVVAGYRGLDAFLRKYGSDGTVIWTNQFGSASNDFLHGVTVGPKGGLERIFVAGSSLGLIEGDVRRGAFIAAFDSSGSALWLDQFGSPIVPRINEDTANAVAVDAMGYVLVAGATHGDLADGPQTPNPDGFVQLRSP